ncbi:hypothetical protein [Nostoc sp. UHCC 0251]|uniref:hypothetical protein n=1 Tax=Nostoc sp. UHCC 0251 TaxID=3110240 RepID=UPI002B209922|nr:hypothetical protein [Nostoc sp. UHCC 0251]MEA5626991.1 hypothetical protein [Nostoc sp. UHCC 0251]
MNPNRVSLVFLKTFSTLYFRIGLRRIDSTLTGISDVEILHKNTRQAYIPKVSA